MRYKTKITTVIATVIIFAILILVSISTIKVIVLRHTIFSYINSNDEVTSINLIAKSGNYYNFSISAIPEGGGAYVIAKWYLFHPKVIEMAQDYPQCGPLESEAVPIELFRYCWSSATVGLIDRVSGKGVDSNTLQGR